MSFVTISTFFGEEIDEAAAFEGRTFTEYLRRAYVRRLKMTLSRLNRGGAPRERTHGREPPLEVAVDPVPEAVIAGGSTRKLGGIRLPKEFVRRAGALARYDGFTHAGYVRDSALRAVRATRAARDRGVAPKARPEGASRARDSFIVDMLPDLPDPKDLPQLKKRG